MGLGMRGVVVGRTRRGDGGRADDASISNAVVEVRRFDGGLGLMWSRLTGLTPTFRRQVHLPPEYRAQGIADVLHLWLRLF
jgi:hypothetical protein